jgi:PAS domain S-box-containing protein
MESRLRLGSLLLSGTVRKDGERNVELEDVARAAERLYEDIITTVREPLIVLTVDLRVFAANQAFYQTFQVDRKETEGQLLFELDNRQWDIPELRGLLQEILPRRTEFQDFEVDRDFDRIGHKTMLLNARQIHGPDGNRYLILLAMEDITERRRVEALLEETAAHLRESSRLAAKGQLLAGITHELNSPLGIILGFAELALEQDLSPTVRGFVQTIRSTVVRADDIVRNLVTYPEKGEFVKTRVEVSAILERVIGLKSHEFRLGNIKVTRDVSPGLPAISANPFQLVEAMLNIVTNALQSMTEAHGGGEIIIRAHRTGDKIRISIQDNGPGVAPEQLDGIVYPFVTTREIGEITGHGSSVVYAIIHRHGGDLWAESVPGVGATHHIELPISPGAIELEANAPEPEQAAIPVRRLLVVNNEPEFRELLALTLSPESYRVDRAKDGNEAWDMVRRQAYDCILQNIFMPGMDGRQLYTLIKGYNADLARKCIFVTGATRSPEVLEFIAATGNRSVYKPFSLGEIRTMVLESSYDVTARSVRTHHDPRS